MSLDPLLRITDRILQRWAVSVGDGLPNAWAANPVAQPPPLPDDLAIDVDQEVMRAPAHVRTVIRCWYRRSDPFSEIAAAFNYKRRESVYGAYRHALAYMTVVFAKKGILERSERSAARRTQLRKAMHTRRFSKRFTCAVVEEPDAKTTTAK
jgi:hypothetical protein